MSQSSLPSTFLTILCIAGLILVLPLIGLLIQFWPLVLLGMIVLFLAGIGGGK